jgi:hypothetical protein
VFLWVFNWSCIYTACVLLVCRHSLPLRFRMYLGGCGTHRLHYRVPTRVQVPKAEQPPYAEHYMARADVLEGEPCRVHSPGGVMAPVASRL